MILAAGEGARLHPLTLATPKLLLPIAGEPLLEYILSWLKIQGISEVAINLHHLPEKVRDSLDDGSRFGMRVFYSHEETLLGTAGGIKRVQQFFKDTFVVIYGDILTDFDLRGMIRFHREKRALATMALTKMKKPWEAGIVRIDKHGKVLSFVEKPARTSEMGNLGNGGVYILEREIFDYIPAEGFADFAYDVFPKLLGLGLPVYGYVLRSGDYLLDIGTLDKYQQASQDVKAGRVKIEPHSLRKSI
jgi:mannose-1-phosphate guanylyltransferase/mannose-1-phosphate guanylyltransferase/phosphomannomutase